MRFYDIWFFMIMINLSLSLVNQLNLFGISNTTADIQGQDTNQYFLNQLNQVNNSIGVVAGTQVNPAGTLSWLNSAYQFIIIIIPSIVSIFINGTILFPIVWLNLGIPPMLVIPLSTITYIVEIFGLVQFMTGRSIKEDQ